MAFDKNELDSLRRKYEGELARVQERKASLEKEQQRLMEELGIKSLDGYDIDKEISSIEDKLSKCGEKLQSLIDEYENLKK